MATDVLLSKLEAVSAINVGAMRHLSSLLAGRKDKHGASGAWDLHINGALGEMVVCKFLGVYWSCSIDAFKRPDIGDNIQVKTRSRHDYELIVRSDDNPDHVFILVTGQCLKYRVHGWLRGGDARRPEWLKTHGGREPAHFAPQSALEPMETLPRGV
jgi:hypothetical protein